MGWGGGHQTGSYENVKDLGVKVLLLKEFTTYLRTKDNMCEMTKGQLYGMEVRWRGEKRQGRDNQWLLSSLFQEHQ